jgi:hypothetical protein
MLTQSYVSLVLVCLVAVSGRCIAQKAVSFTLTDTQAAQTPNNVYAVDVNGDGIVDIVQDTSQLPNGFTVSLGNGDGTFKAPVMYPVPDGLVSPTPLALADFNGDGVVDVVMTLTRTNEVAVSFGNGDGTFEEPKLVNISLPTGQTFDPAAIVAADFNHDGAIDLVASSSGASGMTILSLSGNGAGGFGSPLVIATPAAGSVIQNMTIGDFDTDDNADLAYTLGVPCPGSTFICSSTLYVLYGNGAFAFTSTTPYSSHGPLGISSGDLNSDGRTDLFGIDYAANELAVFYSETTARAFASDFLPLPIPASGIVFNGWMGPLAMADFNADEQMDLVAHVWNPEVGLDQFMFFLTSPAGTKGAFTPQLVNGPMDTFDTAALAADFNNDTKPDVMAAQADEDTAAPYNGPATLIAALNSTAGGIWSNCAYPEQAEGMFQCTPWGHAWAPFNFNLGATSFGQIRKIEVWVDGKKIAEQHHAWGHYAWMNFAYDGTFSQGEHSMTWFVADVDHRLQRFDTAFWVSQPPCYAPSSPGVNICNPLQNGFGYAQPVAVTAAANITGTFARMEVWRDSTKVYTQTNGLVLGVLVPSTPGVHTFTVYAVNTDGVVWSGKQTVATN